MSNGCEGEGIAEVGLEDFAYSERLTCGVETVNIVWWGAEGRSGSSAMGAADTVDKGEVGVEAEAEEVGFGDKVGLGLEFGALGECL